MDKYYTKYLKYKNKYLELKGGGNEAELRELLRKEIPLADIIKLKKYSLKELKKVDVSLDDLLKLTEIIAISELLKAGYTTYDFTLLKVPASKLVGLISLHDLLMARYTPKELKDAGVSLRDMMDERFKVGRPTIVLKVSDLLDAGFTEKELKPYGYDDKMIKEGKEELEFFKQLEKKQMEREKP